MPNTIIVEFVNLFSNMSIVTFVCLLMGLIFIIIEFFQPARGVFGYSGVCLIIAAVVFRVLTGGTVAMVFLLVFFAVALIAGAHLVMLKRQKKGWLTQSLAMAITQAEMGSLSNYAFLVSHEGKATTDINPKGHIAINDINFLVYSPTTITKGARVVVTEVEGDKIFVMPIFDDGIPSEE